MIRIAIVDSGEVSLRLEELASVIAARVDLTLVGMARDVETAAALIATTQPDIVVMNVNISTIGGVAATLQVLQNCSAARVIAFSSCDDHDGVVEMLEAGAVGFMVASDPVEKLVRSVEQVAQGRSVLSAEVAAGVINELLERRHETRQQQVVLKDRRREIDNVISTRGALGVVLQPIVGLEHGIRVGFEALSRFHVLPRRSPERWYRFAREVGLGIDLELAAVDQAFRFLNEFPSSEFLAVNLSPITAVSRRFRRRLEDIDPTRLVIELTEHVPVHDYGSLVRRLHELRELGVKIAIDDTGAGYSSLQHLLNLAPDFIKLDRSLVASIESDLSRRQLVLGILNYAKSSGASVIAEGVESIQECSALTDLGVHYGQGFYLGRPVSAIQIS